MNNITGNSICEIYFEVTKTYKSERGRVEYSRTSCERRTEELGIGVLTDIFSFYNYVGELLLREDNDFGNFQVSHVLLTIMDVEYDDLPFVLYDASHMEDRDTIAREVSIKFQAEYL